MSRIKVRDTGYGILAADLPFIFDRFYRIRNNGHEKIEGNGLGLAIVKSITEQHGGEISVESEPGVGSCFTISFPNFIAAEFPQQSVSTHYQELERGSK